MTVDPAGWRHLYHRAVASACGRVPHPDAERVAATDELVALMLPVLVRLRVLALLADGTPERPDICARGIAGSAADVLRLLDRALAAHGRDNGYPQPAWLDHAHRPHAGNGDVGLRDG